VDNLVKLRRIIALKINTTKYGNCYTQLSTACFVTICLKKNLVIEEVAKTAVANNNKIKNIIYINILFIF
jgi:hypothetical protein